MPVALAGRLTELAGPDKQPHNVSVSPVGESLWCIDSMRRPSMYDKALGQGGETFKAVLVPRSHNPLRAGRLHTFSACDKKRPPIAPPEAFVSDVSPAQM